MYKAVVVDDERYDLEGLRQLIPWSELNIEVVCWEHRPLGALQYIEEHSIDLLVTDIKMPVLSGLELAKRAQDLNSALKKCFISGYQDFEFAKKAIDLKADGYVLKPVDDHELIQVLKNIVSMLEQERDQQGVLEETLDWRRQDIVLGWVSGKPSRHWGAAFAEQLRLSYPLRRQYVAVIEVDRSLHEALHTTVNAQELTERCLEQVVRQFERRNWPLWSRVAANRLAVILPESDQLAAELQLLQQEIAGIRLLPSESQWQHNGNRKSADGLHQLSKGSLSPLSEVEQLLSGSITPISNLEQQSNGSNKPISNLEQQSNGSNKPTGNPEQQSNGSNKPISNLEQQSNGSVQLSNEMNPLSTSSNGRLPAELYPSSSRAIQLQPATITIGLSDCAEYEDGLMKAYEAAVSCLGYKMFLGKNRVITQREIPMRDANKPEDVRPILDRMFQATMKYQLVEIYDCIEQLFEAVQQVDHPQKVYHFATYIALKLQYDLAQLNESFQSLLGWESNNLDKIAQFETIYDIQRWLRSTLFEISETVYMRKQRRNQRLFDDIVQYVEERLEAEITLKEVANYFAYSPNHLGYLFKETMGVSFNEYVLTQRMERAKQLLRNHKLKVYEVADQTGYKSLTHFSRTFREAVGMTPGEFRKQSD